jgi:hypothetical protein
MPDVVSAVVVRDFEVRLTFEDGVSKTVDLEPLLYGRLFGVLKSDPELFRQLRVDAEAGTIVWPNGADICPDLLYYDRTPA